MLHSIHTQTLSVQMQNKLPCLQHYKYQCIQLVVSTTKLLTYFLPWYKSVELRDLQSKHTGSATDL